MTAQKDDSLTDLQFQAGNMFICALLTLQYACSDISGRLTEPLKYLFDILRI